MPMRHLLALSILLAFAAPAAAQELAECTPEIREQIARDTARERAWGERVGELRAAIVAEAPGDTAGFVVLEVDSATQRARVHFVDVAVSDSLRARVAGALIRPLAGELPDRTRHFRVGPRRGDDRPWCSVPGEPPRVLNGRDVARSIARVGSELHRRGQSTNGEARIVVKLLITAEGRPALVLLQELTGDDWLDQRLAETARELRFRPARVGGDPQDVWVTLPLTIFS